MRVLVTGAAGLYGYHLLYELALRDDVLKVIGIDDFSRGFPEEEQFLAFQWGEKIQILKQRFQDMTVKELNSLNVDIVIHLAGFNSGKESINTPEEYFLNNEYGTFIFVQNLLRTRNRPFFIYASTTELYGKSFYIPVDENHPVVPRNIYTATKMSAEIHAMALWESFKYPVAAIRFSNTFGEHQNICGYTPVISSFIDRALRNEPLIIYGTGKQERDFIYVKDAVSALSLALSQRKAVEGKVFNIASGTPVSICDLAAKIKNLTGSSSEIITLPCEPGETEGTIKINTTLARVTLGWTVRYSLEEGLNKTICWYKELLSV